MLIGLLIAYIFLGGSHQTFLLNPSLSKNVSEYVKDKTRKDQIDQTIKQIFKTEETFQKKTEKETGKKLEDLNMSRTSKPADFTKEYAIFYDSLEKLQNTYLTAELKIRGLIHASEWDSIMNKALKQPPQEKINKKILAENKKLYTQLLKTCNDNITDSVNRKKAKGYADEYLLKGNTLANAFIELHYKYIAAIRPYNANRNDFEKPREQMIVLRKNYSGYLVTMRFNLLAITPEKNWDKVAKTLNNDFNYIGAGAKR